MRRECGLKATSLGCVSETGWHLRGDFPDSGFSWKSPSASLSSILPSLHSPPYVSWCQTPSTLTAVL